MEQHAHTNRYDMKNYFSSLTSVYGPAKSGGTLLLGSDGTTLITGKSALFYRWEEHFNGVLNRPSLINDEAIE